MTFSKIRCTFHSSQIVFGNNVTLLRWLKLGIFVNDMVQLIFTLFLCVTIIIIIVIILLERLNTEEFWENISYSPPQGPDIFIS